MTKDSLGDRMKLYEGMEAGRFLMPLLPVICRLDGKAFHTFCKGLERPYDERLSLLMRDTARFLLMETHARVAYTQSDEISLLWHSEDIKSVMFMGGRTAKMVSILAGMASAYFNRHLAVMLPEKADEIPVFDCRVWNTPHRYEAANCFLWREMDATRNSVQMAAQHYYSQPELHKKGREAMLDMLIAKGVNWNDYPAFFKRGTFIQKKDVTRPFTVAELGELPPKHAAHQNPEMVVTRRQVQEVEMPPLGQVTNRVEVLFEGEEPQTDQGQNT